MRTGRKKMKRTLMKSLMFLALGAIISLPGVASADYTFSSITGYFWEQSISGLPFDRIDTTITGPNLFSPALDAAGNAATIDHGNNVFIAAGWKGSYLSPTESTASGPAVLNLQWDWNFAGNVPNPALPITLRINYYSNNVLEGYELYTMGSGGSYSGDYHAPLPPTVVLLGSGLLGLLGLRRKSKSANKDVFM
jgi:hypothetical protein